MVTIGNILSFVWVCFHYFLIDLRSSANYCVHASAKSGVGISLSNDMGAHARLSVFFYLCGTATLNGGLGGGIERCAGFLYPGKANLVQLTTSKISLFSGDSKNYRSIAMKAQTKPIVFSFDSLTKIRAISIDNSPWFIAKDVCDALQLTNSRVSLLSLDDDEKGVSSIYTPGGKQRLSIISESGLYTLMLRCRDAVKPGTLPHRLRKWVTNEVLPQIRKTGQYKSTPQFDDDDIPFPAPEPQPMPGRYLVTIGAGGKKEVVNIDNRNAVDADAMAQLTRDAYYLELLIKDFRERLAVVRGDVDISIFKTPLKDLYR